MRVLLSTIGSRGDVQPLVALALQIRTLGHEAQFCVPPDFQDGIAGLGFSVTPIGPELRRLTVSAPATPPAPLSPERRREMAEASVAAQFETIARAATGCDAIVGATALQIAARSVAEKIGIPYVFVAFCPVVLPSPHHGPPPLPPIAGQLPLPPTADNRELWARDADRFGSLFGPALNSHRASLGLPPVSDVRHYVFTDRPWLAADRRLAPWPDPRDPSVFQPGAWIVGDDRPLSRELETFLDAGEPPVYLGFGSMRTSPALGEIMIESALAVGRRAILSRGWAELSVADNADALVIGEVNQQELFKRVSAVVHHGGAGTTTVAARAGAPQVIIPQLYDQHYWAQRVNSLGIGCAHAPGTATTESLTDALEHALTPDVAARARPFAADVADDGARLAAEHLIEMHRGAHSR